MGHRDVDIADVPNSSVDDAETDRRSGHASSRQRLRNLGILTAWSALLTVLAMPIIDLQAGPGLDPSWQSAMHQLVVERASFGTETAFTFGPLGFLMIPRLYYVATSWFSLLTVVVVMLSASFVTLWSFRRVLPLLPSLLLAYAVLLLGWARLIEQGWTPEATACLVMFVSLVMISRHIDDGPPYIPVRVMAAIFGTISAILLLTKLSSGIQVSAVTLTTLWIVSSRTHRPTRRTAHALGVWLATFLAASLISWTATGQSLGEVGSFLRHSIEITGGYSSAMGVEWSGTWHLDAAVLMLAGLAWLAVGRWGLDSFRANPVIVLPLLIYAFTAFKHGFVRHDRHTAVFFITVALLAISLISRKHLVAVLLVFGFGIAIAAGAQGRASLNPFQHLEQTAEVVALIANPAHLGSEVDESRSALRDQYALSDETIERLSGRTVHIDPWETSMLWAYPEFEWGAVPVFQTYSAYTTDLDELNAAVLRSDRAPEYILRQPWAIDGRHTAFESPAYMIEMACRYQEVASDGGWSILQHGESQCGNIAALSQTTAALGEAIELPASEECDGILVLAIEGLDTIGQTVRSLLYKDFEYYLTLGNAGRFRLVPGTASQPHLIPSENAPSWLGPSLVPGDSNVLIEKSGTGPGLLTPDSVEIHFGCLDVAAA